MSAPTPIDNFKKEYKEFKILSSEKQFSANITLSDIINIKIIENDSNSPVYYFVDLTLERIGKYNKIFKIYDTLEEVYKCLEELFSKKKL